jgi:hypothetical protein
MTDIDQKTIALNDAAAHARVIAFQMTDTLQTIKQRYPKNRLGGLIDRMVELANSAEEHAMALTQAADNSILLRDEVVNDDSTEGLYVGYGDPVPKSVLAVFEAAKVVRLAITLPEAAQVAAHGKLVILRDLDAQASNLVPQFGAIFESDVDPVLVRLWWSRIFCNTIPVMLMETEVFGVWQESVLAPTQTEGQE